jgi:hypothetical protein
MLAIVQCSVICLPVPSLKIYFVWLWNVVSHITGLRVTENRVRRRIPGPKSRKWQVTGEDCTVRILIICALHRILIG